MRRVFAAARAAAPCVLFFDEVDALGSARGRGGTDSAGVADRVLSTMLVEIDALQGTAASEDHEHELVDGTNEGDECDDGADEWYAGAAAISMPRRVFVLAATNRPDLLDPALRRPGRFERAVYVGLPESVEARLGVLRAQTRRLPLASDVDLVSIASSLPPFVSGADMSAVVAAAFAAALRRSGVMSPTLCAVDFDAAMAAGVRPSVSAAELARYEALREQMQN